MNQILYTIENKEEKKKIKNILIFFAITLIVFGVILSCMGGYKIVISQIAKAEAVEAAKVPQIKLEEEANNAIITVKHSSEIASVIYSWNDEEETVITENGSKNVIEYLDVRGGKNTLNVRAIGVDGKTTTLSKEYTYEGTYMDLSVVDNKNIKITVTDVKGLQSVTYRWNSEEAVTAYPEGDNKTVIEITSKIPIGLNTITVNAVNYQNLTQTKEMQVKGITRPTMKMTFSTDKKDIIIRFNDDQGVQSYSYTLYNAPIPEIAEDGKIIENFKDKLTVVNQETKDGNGETSITEKVPFNEGFNYIEVTITNVEGVEESHTGWCAK